MTKKNEQIEIILEDIDLKKIHTVMKALNWTWKDSTNNEKRIPNIEDLRVAAEYCMNKAWESEKKIFKMGGFEAEVIKGAIGLKFVVEDCNPLSEMFG